MRRWNGWGEEAITLPLPANAASFLASTVGAGQRLSDASLESALAGVPASRLPRHPLIEVDPLVRTRHARGQSLPDWIALRSGQIGCFPDGVAYPTSEGEVRELFAFARDNSVRLIPYGGGTSVVGHINPLPGEAPVLTVDLARMKQLLAMDETSRLARFGAGTSGPEIEAALNPLGYTLGHYPQSWEYSTLGGWIATRSSGQQSYYYGSIQNLFAGGHVETPAGPLDLPVVPASSAGPDLREAILGSEGRLGIITSATVRVRPVPAREAFYAAFFKEWEEGVEAVRELAQDRAPVSMLRLSDPLETETTLQLAGRPQLVEWARRGLGWAGFGAGRSLLMFGVTGAPEQVEAARALVYAHVLRRRGLPVPFIIGREWHKSRFKTPYLRNMLWEQGYATDTLETAVPWRAVPQTADILKASIAGALGEERVLALAHLSHMYPDGASIYVTFISRRAADPALTLARWERMKRAASLAIVGLGGTISHQHGVGLDHAPYLVGEKGALGIELIAAAQRAVDPDGIMNPGKLLPE